jgi:hypothetical protein
MTTTTFEIKRPNGNIETVDAIRFGNCPRHLFDRARNDTQAAGRGYILRAIITETTSNAGDIRSAAMLNHNDLYNEGGEGFCPEMTVEQIKAHPMYKETTITTIIE